MCVYGGTTSSYLWECQKNANEKRNPIHFRPERRRQTNEDDDSLKITFWLWLIVEEDERKNRWLFPPYHSRLVVFICCLMASDQTGDWIISLTLPIKKQQRWWRRRARSSLIEGTELRIWIVIIEIYIRLPIFSLHCCFFVLTSPPVPLFTPKAARVLR